MDANDFGVNILGASKGVDRKLVARIIKDNPLGQSDEQTPVGIIHEIKELKEMFDKPMAIRQAELKDKEEIIKIVDLLHLDIPNFVWNQEEFVSKQISNKEYFLGEQGGNIIGVMSLSARKNKMNIETLVVKREFQSQGFGTQFIVFAKQFARDKGFDALYAYSFKEYNMTDFYLKKHFKMLDYPGSYKNHQYYCFKAPL